MDKQQVENEIEKINTYLSRCLWMDFEICRMNAGQVIMAGTIDQSYGDYAIDIVFEEPHFVSSLFYWTTEPSKPFIELVTDEEAYDFNTKYQVEEGNHIFKMNIENFEKSPIFIAARKVTCRIIIENPFSGN
ncbi:MAG: hypothetical protein FWD03_09320 [Defluviitaleaceae bacterium]|nr:hypothetical protein [Defluviitaleaceae bacterium]